MVREKLVKGVYWTLAIEFQYYLFMLLLGQLIISEKKCNVLLFLSISLVLCYLSFDERLLCTHLCYFSFGFLAFLHYHAMLPRWQTAIGLIIVFGTGLILGSLSKVIVALITYFLTFTPVRKALPILSFLGTIIINLTARMSPYFLLGGCLVAASVSVAVSWLMWRLVERPAVRLAHVWASKAARRTVVSGAPLHD
jgi:peptidoglycan/LPS O-acetylase OafA/YrhL